MVLDVDTFNAFLLVAYDEGRAELVQELLLNQDLFADGMRYQVEKRPGLKLVDSAAEKEPLEF